MSRARSFHSCSEKGMWRKRRQTEPSRQMAFDEQKVATIAVTSSPTARSASRLVREVLESAAAAAAKMDACLVVACDMPQRSRPRLSLIALMVRMASALCLAGRVEAEEND